MPLVGIVDPSHDELKARADGRMPEWYSVEDLLAVSASAGPKWSPYPFELIKAMVGEHQERDYISSTMVASGCYRSSVIQRREEYITSLDREYPAFRGTAMHTTLENAARPGSVAEARFHTTVNGVPFSCSPDLVTASGQMFDYKMTENPPTFGYPWRGHTRQLHYNRYIVNNAEKWTYHDDPFDIPFNPRELKFKSLSIVYLGPKGSKMITSEKMQTWETPNGKTAKGKRPWVADDEEVLHGTGGTGALATGMLPRIVAMQTALDTFPEWPGAIEVPGQDEPLYLEDRIVDDRVVKGLWGGFNKTYHCPGPPWCYFQCEAKRYPDGLVWGRPKTY